MNSLNVPALGAAPLRGGSPRCAPEAEPPTISQSEKQAARRVGGQVRSSGAGRATRSFVFFFFLSFFSFFLPCFISTHGLPQPGAPLSPPAFSATWFSLGNAAQRWRKHARREEKAALHRGGCSVRVCRGSALSHPHAEVQTVPERNPLRRREHQISLQERHHLPWNHGRRHHRLLYGHYHHRRGLPGAHETPAFKLHVQPVPVRALQGGRHLPVWRGGQPVPDRSGEVHHRPPSSELPVRVRPDVLQRIRAEHQLHRQPAQCDGVQAVVLLRSLSLRDVLHALPVALRPGQDAGEVDEAGPAHHPVLPGGVFSLRWIHARLRQQAPLERRAGGAAAGRAHRCAHGSIRVGFLQAAAAAALLAGGRTGGGTTGVQAEPAAFGLAARKPLQPPRTGVSRRRAPTAAAAPLSTELFFLKATNNPHRKLCRSCFITMTNMIPPPKTC